MPKRNDPRRGPSRRDTPPPPPQRDEPTTTGAPTPPGASSDVTAGALPDVWERFAGEVAGIAAAARGATDRPALLAALAPLTSLPLVTQLGLTGALGRHPSADTADIAEALAELAPERAVAKEARRATIRLRTAGARPTITIPPPSAIVAIAPAATEEPRFFAAWASRTRETSEVTLVIAWTHPGTAEELDGYEFPLDFWQGRVGDVTHHRAASARRFDREVLTPMAEREHTHFTTITLEQARALLDEALDQREWRGGELPREWDQFEPLLRRRVWRDDITPDASVDALLLGAHIEPEELVVTFWSAWAFGDFELVYALQSERSALRERVTRAEFVAPRRAWFQEARPARLRLGSIEKQAQEQSGLLVLPSGMAAGRANYVFFWSLELVESPLAGQMSEMPMATIVDPETTRHWYWTSTTLERDPHGDEWRALRVRDDGAQAQARPLTDLLRRADDLWQQGEKLADQSPTPQTEEAQQAHARQVMTLVQEALSAGECALARLPTDRALHDKLLDRDQQVGAWDRAAALLQKMLTRFADQGALWRMLAPVRFRQAQQFGEAGDQEGATRLLELATASARAAVAAERTPDSLAMLAEIVIARGEDAEAEALLRESLALRPSVGAWADLGDLLMRQQQFVPAVAAFEEAQRLEPRAEQIRWRLGRALELAQRPDEARLAYEDALERNPDDAMAHALLGNLHFTRQEFEPAYEHLTAALRQGLVSSQVLVQLAEIEARSGHPDRARILLEQAARIDPAIAPSVRQVLAKMPGGGGKRDKR